MVSIAPRMTSAVTWSTVGRSWRRPRWPASWTRSTFMTDAPGRRTDDEKSDTRVTLILAFERQAETEEGNVRAPRVPGHPRVRRRERARAAGRRVHVLPRGAPSRGRDREEPRLGACRRRDPVRGAPQAAVQGVLLPRQVVHDRV